MRNTRYRQLIGQNAPRQDASLPIIQAKKTDEGIEVLIYDVIDPWWGVSAAGFADAIKDAGDSPLTVRLNSPGGDVFDGRAIASMIRQHKGPTKAIVDGLAASAASTIAVAAQETVMATGSFIMVHDAWAFAMDNAKGLRQMADLLEKIDTQIAADYAAKAGVTAEQAAAWMDAETWFTADEAVEAGLASAVLPAAANMKSFALDAFERPPQALLNAIAGLKEANDNALALRAKAEKLMRLYG